MFLFFSFITKALLSKKLVELEKNVPLEAMSIPSRFKLVSDFRMEKFNPDRLLSFYDRMGFQDLKKRMKSRISSASSDNDKRNVLSSSSSTINKYYDSILERKRDVTSRSQSSSISERYGSILETHGSSDDDIVGTTPSMGGDNKIDDDHLGLDQSLCFSDATNYTVPPEPEEYTDVPF